MRREIKVKRFLIVSVLALSVAMSGFGIVFAENTDTENENVTEAIDDTDNKTENNNETASESAELGFSYTVSNDGVTITNVDDVSGKVTIPSEIDGKDVIEIANGAFGGSTNITEVYIPDSVVKIGETAFAYSTGIKKVRLSKALKVIPNGAFNQCTSLIGITVPYGVTVIEDNAFSSCPSLSSVSVPTTVTNISANAFDNSPNVVFYCKLSDEPYGVSYANEHGIRCENLINVYLNGEEVDFDQAPITDNKRFRTLVPLRSVLEDMGAKIEWYNDMEYAGLNIGDYRILIKPNSEFMRVNDETVFLSSPAVEYNERILLPIRDVVQAVGGKVVWNENSTSVFITYTPEDK